MIVPLASGVLSAVGLIAAERRRDLVESVLLAGDELTADAIGEVVERLAERGRDELDAPDADVRPAYDLRYAGQAFELTISGEPRPDPAELRAAFERAHEERYGYADSGSELELVTVRVAVALEPAELPPSDAPDAEDRGTPAARASATSVMEAAVVRGAPGELDGPAIVELPESTVVVPPGWRCSRRRPG